MGGGSTQGLGYRGLENMYGVLDSRHYLLGSGPHTVIVGLGFMVKGVIGICRELRLLAIIPCGHHQWLRQYLNLQPTSNIKCKP